MFRPPFTVLFKTLRYVLVPPSRYAGRSPHCTAKLVFSVTCLQLVKINVKCLTLGSSTKCLAPNLYFTIVPKYLTQGQNEIAEIYLLNECWIGLFLYK